ncbi:ABC transporter permease subunit [Paenibacillus sp. N5-1-1-5]|uniref:ABC transporter permease subunit n=2 Tax=Paenibacillus radicis (ex Xue et al. 2023) TaxID=2972489 RepID=A0ABT1YTD5_9BACL|nr:ABC transporter permease subunit [Paenibacillus radicis (ex Xue et al. 2023)]MCR8636443.1 ABC transporter permease subunit [Paenibacillus radicis (ex Xue et al. 2023)]
MMLPGIVYYIVFHYIPMYGATIAFKNFTPVAGIWGSAWIGFKHFQDFFNSYYFLRIIKNTLLINFYSLLFGFPAPIILALLLNEVRKLWFKRTVQTLTYLPHFVSVMVISGLIVDFTSKNGLINDIIEWFGGTRANLLMNEDLFRTIFVSSGIWQEIGWGSIIYLAALSGIDQEQYDAANIDGAGRFRQMLSVTLPGIMPTIIILLILRIGHMMDVGFEKVILLYNPSTYATADVISSFVFRKGIVDANYSYSAAIGLFNSLINFILLIGANKLSRKYSDSSLW